MELNIVVMARQFVEELAKYSSVPVWNETMNSSNSDVSRSFNNPRAFWSLKGIHFTYMGDARYNMGNSLMIACSKMGLHFTACTNKKYFPDESLVEQCKAFAKGKRWFCYIDKRMLRQERRLQMSFILTYGYPWASRLQYGRSVSTICFHIR